MRSAGAPAASITLASGTPSNFTASLYHGGLGGDEVSLVAPGIARSNCAVPSLLVTLILPVTVRIGLSVGAGRDAAPARFAATSMTVPKNDATRNRSAECNRIDTPFLRTLRDAYHLTKS